MDHCRQLFTRSRNRYTYTFLLIRDAEMEGLTEALVAGVDDFLAKPLVYGELLARLRSGARVLEYERRMREQSAVDTTTALLNESAFRDRLASELLRSEHPEIACVVVDLDFFDHVNRVHGFHAGDEAPCAVAQCIKGLARECRFLASLGPGRFAAVLPGASDAQALAWGETVRQAVAELEIPLKHETISLTASVGVAGTMHGATSVEELIQRAEDAVRTAKSSGRNCVARCGQFDGETREWEDLARQGRLFENTVARDVMVPCPAFLQPDQDIRRAAALLTESRLREIPVVDRKGKILGLLSAAQLPPDLARSGNHGTKVADVMLRNFIAVPEHETFASLMELFMDDARSLHVVVVVRHDKPLGIVYRSGLAALSEPLHITSFAPDKPYSTCSDYLVIPDFAVVN